MNRCTNCGRESPPDDGKCSYCGSVSTPSGDSGPSPTSRPVDSSGPLTAVRDPSENATGVRDLTEDGTGIREPSRADSDFESELFQPGQSFGERYRIIRILGTGGMGAVYHAWDEELGIGVALKVIRRRFTENPRTARELEERFKRELLLARQVTHKNVVRIYDIGSIEGTKYITMSYVRGSDLATRLRSEGKLPVKRTLNVARQVAAGLAAAHDAGVVHRDLKPANIMVGDDGTALIMDFGLARSALRDVGHREGTPRLEDNDSHVSAQALGHTAFGEVMGTARYMAPEQARGLAVNEIADVYAFGLILRQMLVPAFDGHEPGSIDEMLQRMETPPASLRVEDSSIPEGLDKIVQKCLQPDPRDRYRSGGEVAAALDGLDDEGNPLPVYRALGPKGMFLAATLVLALVAGSWEISRRWSAPPVEPDPTSVLVADFDNLSGNPVFAGSVEQAMNIALEESPFVNAYSRTEAHSFVERLSPGSNLTPAMARLVSRREGIGLIVTGEIESADDGYRISVQAWDSASDAEGEDAVATVSRIASNEDEVLDVVEALATEIRGALGDTETDTERAAEAETFTASSLAAMSAYARGQELYYQGRHQEALEAYEQAVTLDPGLGRAYAGMGVIYHSLGQVDEAQHAYDEALKNVDRMTEREKYRTLGGYYILIARNQEKAIENYQTLVELYPADNAGHANLALASLYVRDIDRAVEEGRKAIEIYPHNVLQRANYAMYCMYAGDFETAIEEANRVLDTVSDEYALLTVALSNIGLGDAAAARETYRHLAEVSDFGASVGAMGECDLEMYHGRYRAALPLLRTAIASDREEDRVGSLAQKYVALAEAHLALGDPGQASEAAREAVELSEHESALFPAARVLLQAGQEKDVLEIIDRLENQLQSQTRSYAELLRAEIAESNDRLPDAIEAFRAGLARHNSWFGRYLLGVAYAKAGHFAEALAELELCLARRGETSDAFFADSPTVRYFPPVYYWLARAQEEVGSATAARESYAAFLALREDSDIADPLAEDAVHRLAAISETTGD